MMKISLICPHCQGESSVVFDKLAPKLAEPDVLDLPLDEIIWPDQHTRILGVFSSLVLETLGYLVQKSSERELMRQSNFGKHSLAAVKLKLAEFGLKLKLGDW